MTEPVVSQGTDRSPLWATFRTPTTPPCAFNATFDLTMLGAELLRHYGRSPALSGPKTDMLVIRRARQGQQPETVQELPSRPGAGAHLDLR